MKPVSKASDNVEPVIKAGKADPYEALGTLGKKAKKPRCLPPKRAMRMLLDPYRYGQMHLSGAILDTSGSELPAVAEGTWEYVYDDIRFDDIGPRINPTLVSGKWIYHVSSHATPSTEAPLSDQDERAEVVPGKRKRVAEQLEQIAATSVFPDTLNDTDNEPSAKKTKSAQPSKQTTTSRPPARDRKFALDDDDMPALDDDDIWGEAIAVTEQEAVSLFNTAPAAVAIRKGPLKAVVIPSQEVHSRATDPAVSRDDLSDVDFDDADALFDNAAGDATETPSSPLFQAENPAAKADESQVPVAQQSDSEDEVHQSASTGVGMSLTEFARAERQKGMSVLQSLGIGFADSKKSPEPEDVQPITFSDDDDASVKSSVPKTVKPSMAWLYDEEDEDEGHIPPAVPRLRGGGDASQDHAADNDDNSDTSDSHSESGADSEEDSSSDREDKADARSVPVEKNGGKQSLKDMFAAQPERKSE